MLPTSLCFGKKAFRQRVSRPKIWGTSAIFNHEESKPQIENTASLSSDGRCIGHDSIKANAQASMSEGALESAAENFKQFEVGKTCSTQSRWWRTTQRRQAIWDRRSPALERGESSQRNLQSRESEGEARRGVGWNGCSPQRSRGDCRLSVPKLNNALHAADSLHRQHVQILRSNLRLPFQHVIQQVWYAAESCLRSVLCLFF